MDVALIRTEGRGGEAEVEVDGCRLAVVDDLSPADLPAPPGPVPEASLEVLTIAHLSGRARGDEEPGLVREWGWRYRGTGEVVSTEPLRAELGPFTLAVDLPGAGELAVGDRVTIAIDRIVLRRAAR